jgi:predicted nucleic acid-binding protein
MSVAQDAAHFICVDSSVVFKWFCSEDEASVEEALALFADHIEGRVALVAPAHLPAEVLNALNNRRGLSSADVTAAAEALAESEIVYPAWDPDLLADAVVLARRHKLTVNDALFPALAVQLDCELVTADRAQARVGECPVRLLR